MRRRVVQISLYKYKLGLSYSEGTMMKPQSKQTLGEASAGPARGLPSDVIVFNGDAPLSRKIIWLLFAGSLFVGPAFAGFWFFPQDLFGILLFGVYFGIWAIVIVCGIVASDELTIDLSERSYRVVKGLWPFIRTQRGSLSEVRHLCLQSRISYDRRTSTLDIVVVMVWKNDQPGEFMLESRSAIARDTTCIKRNKKELKTYAKELAARLQVPVIDSCDQHESRTEK